MAVLKGARAAGEGLVDPLGQQDRADRLIAAAEALGDRHEIGRDPLLFAGVQRAGAPHAAHHLVENEQNPIAVADRPDALEIIADRRDSA